MAIHIEKIEAVIVFGISGLKAEIIDTGGTTAGQGAGSSSPNTIQPARISIAIDMSGVIRTTDIADGNKVHRTAAVGGFKSLRICLHGTGGEIWPAKNAEFIESVGDKTGDAGVKAGEGFARDDIGKAAFAFGADPNVVVFYIRTQQRPNGVGLVTGKGSFTSVVVAVLIDIWPRCPPGSDLWKVLLVFITIGFDGQADLFDIVEAGDSEGGFLAAIEDGQQHRRKNCDDGNNNQ